MSRILVTGASGFIGSHIVAHLISQGRFEIWCVVRRQPAYPVLGIKYFIVPDISTKENWQVALMGVDVVIHTAARAHIFNKAEKDSRNLFQRINVDGTLRLAEQAAAQGVRRFIFLSSIGVNGAKTENGQEFSELDEPNPHNEYAISKREAEEGLRRASKNTDLEIVIIRPPLVYGANAPGNFGMLMHIIKRGWYLPLGGIENKRSLIAIDNLIDFITICIDHNKAANQIFLVSDEGYLSTTELVSGIARAAGLPVRLISIPSWLLLALGILLRKTASMEALCADLQLDARKARNLLDWRPKISTEEGLRRAAVGRIED